MAGVLGIYGLIIAVIISTNSEWAGVCAGCQAGLVLHGLCVARPYYWTTGGVSLPAPQCASSHLPAHLPRPRLRSAAVNQTADKAYYFFDGYAHFAAGLVSHGTCAACCSEGTGQQATSAQLPAAAAPPTLELLLCTPAVRGPSH